ncbi:MAG TPA: hypothetical protein VGQ83_23410 [Polyangia bacterium]|jgi:hypothetical protein
MTLELDYSEKEALATLLRARLDELHTEIHHTDHAAFRQQLKQLDEQLRRILIRLTTPEAPLLTHM